MKRYHQINFLRTILITLVILVHIVHFGTLYPSIKAGILAFMMPSFLVVTGYLVNIHKTLKEFGLYLLRILIPYVLFVTSFSILSVFLPVRDGISEISIPLILHKIFVTSIGPYWFLYVMIGTGAAYYLSFKLLPLGEKRWANFLVFAAILCLLSTFMPLMSLSTVGYYFLGTMIRQYEQDLTKVFRPNVFSWLPFFYIIFYLQCRDWGSLPILIAVWCFISGTFFCYRFIGKKLSRYTDFIGMNTLPIYLFHPIFTMLGKFYQPFYVWDKSGLWFTMIVLISSFAGSIFLAYGMDKARLSIILGKSKLLRPSKMDKKNTNIF